MSNMIYCFKYNLKVNPDMEENCKGCIFNTLKKDEDDHIYFVCGYLDWKPGLKKGREWGND